MLQGQVDELTTTVEIEIFVNTFSECFLFKKFIQLDNRLH